MDEQFIPNYYPPVHPGEILLDELVEMDITPDEFARQIEAPPEHIAEIIAGKRSITGEIALRIGHWFKMEPRFWMNLQTQYDLEAAEREIGDVVQVLPTVAKSG